MVRFSCAASSALGTVHAWAERELRRGGASLCPEAVDLLVTSGERTSRWLAVTTGQTSPADGEKERELLERRCARTFRVRRGAGRLSGAGDRGLLRGGGWRVRAGRIDAPSSNVSGEGQSSLVVDWKSGRPVASDEAGEAGLFLRRSCACTGVWAARRGVDPSEVGAMVLAGRRTTRWNQQADAWRRRACTGRGREGGTELTLAQRHVPREAKTPVVKGQRATGMYAGPSRSRMPGECRPPQRRLMFSRDSAGHPGRTTRA